MISKTKEYNKFKFRVDNRKEIKEFDIMNLVNSIKSRNLLEFRPIIVNSQMEVLDGQHRLLAAKRLGFDIYYKVEDCLSHEDMLKLNLSVQWKQGDYLNYFVQNGYEEYIKLKEFMEKYQLNLNISLTLTMSRTYKDILDFKQGRYIFKDNYFKEKLQICLNTINYIKKMNGSCNYVLANKFWNALLKVLNHGNFNLKVWERNLEKLVCRIGPRVTCADYFKMLVEVYNFRTIHKIDLDDKEQVEDQH